MKCITAMGLMSAYIDHKLPEQTARALRYHIQVCEECHTEYVIWKESSEWFKSEMHSVPLAVEHNHHTSIAEGVMSRIVKEENWSIPIAKRLSSITPKFKRVVTTIAILFLLVFAVMMVSSFHNSTQASTEKGEWKEISSKDIVLSIDQMKASSTTNTEENDIRYRIVASLGTPLRLDRYSSAPMLNSSLVAGFFGIMVTIVGMSWLSRN